MPRPEVLITPEVRRRFLREARAAGGLDHPNIVAVHEVGEAGPVCYIASAYCAGPTLSAWLKARTEPVPPRLAAQLVAPLSDAVQHAHDRGVLHRDIKPSNVILAGGRIPGTEDSAASLVPRLTDFGLARIAEETGDETRTGVPLGSPPYMAPEQAAGRSRDVGPATDVYALGAILYEILTGRAAVPGRDRDRDPAPGARGRARRAAHLAPGPASRPGDDLPEVPGEGPGTAVRHGPGAARGPRSLSEPPADPRAADLHAASGWASGSAAGPVTPPRSSWSRCSASALVGGIVYRNVLLQNHAVHLEREVARADANARLARRHLEAFQLRQASEALNAHQVERSQDILRAIEADRESSGGARKPGDLGFRLALSHEAGASGPGRALRPPGRTGQSHRVVARRPDPGHRGRGRHDPAARSRDRPPAGRPCPATSFPSASWSSRPTARASFRGERAINHLRAGTRCSSGIWFRLDCRPAWKDSRAVSSRT